MVCKPRDYKQNKEHATKALGSKRLEELESFLANHCGLQYLAGLIELEPHLEFIAPFEGESLCFRYVFDGVDELDLVGVNRMILYELWRLKQGRITEYVFQGRYGFIASNIGAGMGFQDLNILVEQ